MAASRKYSQEVRELGVHRETLRLWVRRTEADCGRRGERLTGEEREELRRLRKETAKLRRANERLKVASAFFDGELDEARRS